MAKLISLIVSGTILAIVMGSGIGNILSQTQKTVDGGNIHQLATAVEMYYYDHGNYPEVSNGTELVNLLQKENYLQSTKLTGDQFRYSAAANGEKYELKLKVISASAKNRARQ